MKARYCHLLFFAILFHLAAFATCPKNTQPTSGDSIQPVGNLRGDLSSIKLHTGTEIWINDETELKTRHANDGIYSIENNGEMYVKVPDSAKKLIVHTSYRDTVEVYPGSEANIKAYKQDNFYRTTAVFGKVVFTRLGRSRIIKPGETVELNYGKDSTVIIGCDWRDSMQVFDSTPERVIFNTFSRHYHAQIHLDCKKIMESRGNMNFYYSWKLKSILEWLGAWGKVYDVTQPKENYFLLQCRGKCKDWVM